jgi:hypothetical protein
MHLNCFFAPSSQGRRNDIIRKKSPQEAPPPSPGSILVRVGRRSDGFWSIIETSERVHYPPSTHTCALRGSSCCADFKSPTNHPHLRPISSSHDGSLLTQAWFHVYSHMKSNCSRRTPSFQENPLLLDVRKNHCSRFEPPVGTEKELNPDIKSITLTLHHHGKTSNTLKTPP